MHRLADPALRLVPDRDGRHELTAVVASILARREQRRNDDGSGVERASPISVVEFDSMTASPAQKGGGEDIELLFHAGRAELPRRGHIAQHRGGNLRRLTPRAGQACADGIEHMAPNRFRFDLSQIGVAELGGEPDELLGRAGRGVRLLLKGRCAHDAFLSVRTNNASTPTTP